VSRHLKVLEGAGLVSSVRRGGSIIHALQTSVLEDLVTEIADMAWVGRPSRSTTSRTGARRAARPKRA
jgi:DNA-binding transcriptional ArsR family regulator